MDSKKIDLKKISYKKLILILLLLAFLVFAYMQKSDFIKSDGYFCGVKCDKEFELEIDGYIPLQGSASCEQQFVASHKDLDTVGISFRNPKMYEASGTVNVAIKDSEGKKVCDVSIDANKVTNKDVFLFEFTGKMAQLNASKVLDDYQNTTDNKEKISLEKGETYTVVITTDNVKSPGKFGVNTCNNTGTDGFSCKDANKTYEGRSLSMVVSFWRFLYPVFGVFIFFTLLGIAIICIPDKRIPDVIVTRVMFFLTPAVGYTILAKIAGDTLTRTIRHFFTLDGLLTLFIIGLLWWLIYVISNRVKITTIATTVIVFLFGLACYLMYLFRGSQLTAGDFYNIQTGLSVIGTYSPTFDKAALWAIMITLIWICLAINFKGHKGMTLKQRLIPLVILAVWGLSFNMVFFSSNFLKHHLYRVSSFAPDHHYRTYGYALAFTITASAMRIEKPEEYDVAAVEKVAEKYVSDKAEPAKEPTETTPNVIGIMNESFADMSVFKGFEKNKDPMPFTRSLKENTVKGTMHSSVFGARTANSEFEFLTGFTTAFLPYGSMAYNGHVKEGTPNLTTLLKQQDYCGITAFHPGKRDSYSRDVVYPNLGFNTHVALEDLKDPELLRAYVSDSYDYKFIREDYEKCRQAGSKMPYYMFNVTIQNHANYTSAEGKVDEGIDVLTESIKYANPVNYENLIKCSDDAFKELIEYFQTVDEPTVIVLFGDHQPQFNTNFYQTLIGKSEDKWNLEEMDTKYRVPFVIWANYDIEEEEGVEISANYISSYMLSATHSKMTGYDKYLMDLHKTLPVISQISYMDKDGKFYSYEEDSKYSDLINQYQCIQYNGLVDIDNRIDDFFNLK